MLYFSRRRGLAIRPRLLPRPRLEVLPQTELLGEKAVVDAAPQTEVLAGGKDVGPRVA